MELSLIHLEIQSVDKLIEPKGEAKVDEHLIGYPSDYAKKVYTLWMLSEKEAKLIEADLRYGDTTDETELESQFVKFKCRAQLLEALFWYVCKEEFETWNCPIGIRKEWKLVKTQNSPLDFLNNMFRGMMGD